MSEACPEPSERVYVLRRYLVNVHEVLFVRRRVVGDECADWADGNGDFRVVNFPLKFFCAHAQLDRIFDDYGLVMARLVCSAHVHGSLVCGGACSVAAGDTT